MQLKENKASSKEIQNKLLYIPSLTVMHAHHTSSACAEAQARARPGSCSPDPVALPIRPRGPRRRSRGGGSAGGRGGVRRAEKLLTLSFALFLVCRERRTSTSPMMSYLASGKHHKILSVEVIGERHLGR